MFFCAWPIHENGFRYARTKVALELPQAFGLWDWKFNRSSLTVEPVMMKWIWANFTALIFMSMASLLAVVFAWTAIEERAMRRE